MRWSADDTVVVFGEDVAVAEGPFKTSEGLLERFGPLRVRDTPISEMGFLGLAVGAAACGLRPVAEIMFVEFVGVALDQLTTEAAFFHYLSNGELTVPLVVRASVGSGLGFGLQHSRTLEQWLLGTPGLKVVSPSDGQTAYGLLRSAISDDNPVVVLEPRALYAERYDVVTGDEGLVPLGRAAVVRPGSGRHDRRPRTDHRHRPCRGSGHRRRRRRGRRPAHARAVGSIDRARVGRPHEAARGRRGEPAQRRVGLGDLRRGDRRAVR